MRLDWFSPLPPAASGTAHCTASLLPALASRAEVRLWTDQATWDPTLEELAEVRRYQIEKMPWEELNRSDLCVYQIGNHMELHAAIWEVSRRHGGLVVLHDPCLQDFFTRLYLEGWQDEKGYRAAMERIYGAEGARAADALRNGKLSVDALNERYPLTPLALENALGVLVHSPLAFDALAKRNRWPVVHAPLPCPAGPRGACRRRSEPPFRLVVFGFLGKNRCLDVLLLALAEFPERDRFRLDVYGSLWDPIHVRGRLDALGLQETVTLHGFVPEAELDAALSGADLAVNLRHPTMGEASASQLRIWMHALPSLVTPLGWYAGLSREAVAFVRPGHEPEDIQAHLRAFLADPARFAEMGENGRRILEREHTPEAYVRAITGFAAQAGRHRCVATAWDLADRAGAEMAAWADPKGEAEWRSVATAIRDLLVEESP